MSHPQKERSEQPAFLAGPCLSTGPEFAQKVKEFLTPLNSPDLLAFAQNWLDAIKDDQLPTWAELQLHRKPTLLANALMLERLEQDGCFLTRFVGEKAIELAGFDPTGQTLDAIGEGEVLDKWLAVNNHCLAENALCIVSFDLGFVDKEYRKLDAIIFPLGPEVPTRFVCGFYLWYS